MATKAYKPNPLVTAQNNYNINKEVFEKESDKKHEPISPSKVIHIRNLPSDITYSEVVSLTSEYGNIKKMILSRRKSQALIEMATLEASKDLIKSDKKCILRNRPVFLQFSTYSQLHTNIVPPKVKQVLSAANEIYRQKVISEMLKNDETENINEETELTNNIGNLNLKGNIDETDPSMMILNHSKSVSDCIQPIGDISNGSVIIRAFVENCGHPINVDIFSSIFSKYGYVKKAVGFVRNGICQALIEMSDSVSAYMSLKNLNGTYLYPGFPYKFRLTLSKLTSLKIDANTNTQKDFTIERRRTIGSLRSLNNNSDIFNQMKHNYIQNQLSPITNRMPPFGLDDMMSMNYYQPDNYHTMYAPYNMLPYPPYETSDYNNSILKCNNYRAVLLISNLCKENTTPDTLYNIFSIYGNILRIKIIFNKKDSALIQFYTNNEAENAKNILNDTILHGKKIAIINSKYCNVQFPKNGHTSEFQYTKSYSGPCNPIRLIHQNSKYVVNRPTPALLMTLLGDISSDGWETLEKIIGKVYKKIDDINAENTYIINTFTVDEASKILMENHLKKIENVEMVFAFSRPIPVRN
ncbi:hypothetical protein A3Q56_04855 [Intoshia linei]|uniref:RRM domain-containing protein n=1 Tax=Intoshia linei TaxID=1819745 RepID=A0A177AZI2_9BILA|nr:hypothetical protein A3Q56_04855 [Intoshia linei]